MLIPARELLKRTVDLYKKNFNLFLSYVLALFIPTGVSAILAPIIEKLTQEPSTGGSIALALYIIIVLITWIVSLWVSITFMKVIYQKYNRNEVRDIKIELQHSGHLLLPALLVSILTYLIIFGGFVLLIIPGIIFSVWFAFSIYEVVLKNKKVIESIKASKALVKGRWWAVLWRLVVPIAVFGLALIIVNSLVGGILSIVTAGIEKSSSMYTFVSMILGLVLSFISLLFTPLTNGALVILFSELQNTPVIPKPVAK
jgi:hypothetical protein